MGNLICSFLLVFVSFNLLGQANLNFNIKEIKPFPNDVYGFAVNPTDATLYFTSFYTGNLCKLDYPYTSNYTNTGITGQRPAGLLWFNQSLYMADLMEGNIKQYDASLNLITTHNVPSPWNMTTDGQSIYVVTFNGELYKIHNNQLQLLNSTLAFPFDITYSPHNTLYVSEQGGSNTPGRIAEYDLNGVLLSILPNIFSTPLGISFDSNGNLFIVDNHTNCIFCIQPDGSTSLVSCNFDKPIAAVPNLSDHLFFSSATSGGTLLEVSMIQATNLNELSASNLLLFPNPATHQLYISIEQDHSATSDIELFTFSGKKIPIYDMAQHQHKGKLEISINTKHLQPGNYLVKITTDKSSITKQFSISR